MDVRVALARDHHRASVNSVGEADRHRLERDRLVRQLRMEDPARWTHKALSEAIGCSPELIAHIIRNPPVAP